MDTPDVSPENTAPAAEETPKEAVSNEQPKSVEEQTPAEKKAEIKKWKLKFGDKEEEVEEEELVRRAQKAWGIEKKAEQANKQYKMSVELIRLLKEEPLTFAERARSLGIDPKALAIEIINQEIELEKMTPEQRELAELRKEKAAREKGEAAKKQAALDAILAKKTEDFRENLQKDMISAIEKHELPHNQWTAARFAAYIQAGLEKGVQYAMDDIGKQVAIEWHQAMNAQLERYSDDVVLEKLSPKALEKITKARMKKVAPPASPFKKKDKETPVIPPADKKSRGNYWKELKKQHLGEE